MNISTEKKWYALYTKPRHEKKVAEFLTEKNIENYLPLVKTIKQWSDRKKKVEETLIKSYIFVQANHENYIDILQIQGVVKFIAFEGKAAPIPEYQINAIRSLLDSDIPVEITTDRFSVGKIVKINAGLLKGIEGEIVSIAGKNKLLLRINNIGYSLLIELKAQAVSA